MGPSPGAMWARGMGNLVRNMRGEGRTSPGLDGRIRDARPLTPAPGSPCMMPERVPRTGCGEIGSGRGSVLSQGGRRTMSQPKPRDMNSKLPNIMIVPRQSGQNPSAVRAFLTGKGEYHAEGPYLARQLSVSRLGVLALTSNKSACLPKPEW